MEYYDSKFSGEELERRLDLIVELDGKVASHNKEIQMFCIEPVTVIVGGVETICEAGKYSTVFVGDEEFEIIPTSNNSIKILSGYPIPLTWYDWLDGVDVFQNIIFDMNELETYGKWIQYNQGAYHVQKAQYSNCIFWSDMPYTHNPFEARTNYTIYHSAELPLCYSTIPENTYKPFYCAYGVTNDPNWANPDYVNSYAAVSGATQTFSYYGATAIGIFNMNVDVIALPKDCRGLMFYSPAIQHAGIFDATKTTNFGAKKGSWQEAFGYCTGLTTLYIKNLKASINVSWSPLSLASLSYIIENAINTTAITISLSPYTWYRLTDEIRTAATAKNITLALISTNYADDSRWATKQDTISDIATIRSGAALGATALQSIPEEYVTETELSGKGYATQGELSSKVDKVTGKQLSTEDFTTLLKEKLESLNNYDDTGISQAVLNLQTQLNTLLNGDSSSAIENFNEIVDFLDNIEDSDSLDSIIAGIEQQIAAKQDVIDDLDTIRNNASTALTNAAAARNETATLIGIVDGKQDEIDDLSTIRTNAANGNIAYSWGTHVGRYIPITGASTIKGQLTPEADAQYNLGITTNRWKDVHAITVNADNIYKTSDERLKVFENDVEVDFSALKNIPKKYFIWKDGHGGRQIGVSAQEVQKIYPELVNTNEKGSLSVDYESMLTVALKAIDLLNQRVETLEKMLRNE